MKITTFSAHIRWTICFLLCMVLMTEAAAGTKVYAADADDSTLEIETELDSFRYSDGSVLEDALTDTESIYEEASLASSSTTMHSSWSKSCGTSAYKLVTETTTGSTTTTTTKKVSVSGVARVGIDVSKWNGDVDWEKVAAAGVSFVIIRAFHGVNYDDDRFLEYVQGASEAGLSIGVYAYSLALTVKEAQAEAEHMLDRLEEAGLDPDDIDLAVFYDMEDSTQQTLSASKLGSIAETFCGTLQEAGYAVGIYANQNWWNNYLTDDAFENETWYKWVACWPKATGVTDSGIDDADLWQFTSQGTVSGISGNVDISFDYLGEDAYVPMQPKKVTLSSVTLDSSQTSAVLTWKKLSNATGYRIYRSTNGGSYERVATITSNSVKTWTDTDIEAGNTYTYKIRAYNVACTGTKVFGSYSSTLSVTTKPDKVSLSSATLSYNENYVTVKWTAVSACTGYRVYRSTDGGDYVRIATVEGTSVTSYKDYDIEDGKVYVYKVRAYTTDTDGTKVFGSYSSKRGASTTISKMTLSSVKLNTSLSKVTVKWKSVSGIDGYRVYRSTDGTTYTRIATITDTSATSYQDTDIEAGVTYTYKVRAFVYTSDGVRALNSFSSTKSVTVKPAQMTLKSAKADSSYSKVTVKWETLSGVDGYRIYRSTDGGDYVRIATITDITTTSYSDTTVEAGKTYTYKIRAYKKNSSGTKIFGSYSSTRTVVMKPAQMTLTSVKTNSSLSKVTIKWTALSDADGYRIYRSTDGGDYVRIATITDITTTSYSDTDIESGKTYTYKIRAYKIDTSGSKLFGKYSITKEVTIG